MKNINEFEYGYVKCRGADSQSPDEEALLAKKEALYVNNFLSCKISSQ